MDAGMPKEQTAAGKTAPTAARDGESYTTALGRQAPAGSGVTAALQASATNPALGRSLEHRSPLSHSPGFPTLRGTGLFERIGGQLTIDTMVDVLYQGIDGDHQLRPLFPHDPAEGRSMQKLFFAEWLGGPRRYSERAYGGLRHRHEDLPITPVLAERWLAHFARAVEATVAAERDRGLIVGCARTLATALVNRQVAAAPPTGPGGRLVGKVGDGAEAHRDPQPVTWCGIGGRTVTRAKDLARRGDVSGLSDVLAQAPDLRRGSYAAAIMQAAVLAGRAETVRILLDRGFGPDCPFYLPVGVTGLAFERVIFVTPLGAARMKRRTVVESMLMAAGANEDVFTSAFLGELGPLARMLAEEPHLAEVTDPATDVLDITPVEHAVAGGQVSALVLILDHLTHPLVSGVRALRGAAAQGDRAMVELLLARGADATRIGVGRWVLHPELAPLLASRGARIDSSGVWIGASCTGNQGRKDDPEYVRALLRHGADANDRRTSGPERTTGVQALNATALHHAARAGFLQTIQLLIEHGADPDARDSHGRTPLDWLEQAAPSVPRAAVRNLLTTAATRAAGR
jgi:truncated hemoglobin YjbI